MTRLIDTRKEKTNLFFQSVITSIKNGGSPTIVSPTPIAAFMFVSKVVEEIGDIEVSVKYGKKGDMGNLPLLATLKKGKDANAGGVDGN